MNKERILILAKLLEMAARRDAKPKLGFNMGAFMSAAKKDRSGHSCGTTACIGGWAVAAFDPDSERHPPVVASDALGLTDLTAYMLFFPSRHDAYSATPRRAARVLRHLAKTGEVDWSIQ